MPNQTPTPNPEEQSIIPQSKSTKPWLIILIIALAAAIIVGLVIYSIMAKSASNQEADLEQQIQELQQQINQLPESTGLKTPTQREQEIDSDNDGLSDTRELQLGTDPNHPDTDRDGYLDGNEVANGYDPLVNEKTQAEIKKADVDCGLDNKFISEDLGIAFCYPGKDLLGLNKEIEVKQIGDKVYVDGIDGQSVEVFEKNRHDSLKQTIEKTFSLNKYKDCWVEDGEIREREDGGIISSALFFTRDPNDDGPPFDSGVKCPAGYSITNGAQYFYTKDNADKFLFFRIGQYAIGWPDGRLWQDTIKFLD